MKRLLSEERTEDIMLALASANRESRRSRPGMDGTRQPVQSMYGGAHLFRADTAQKIGRRALEALKSHASDGVSFCQALGLDFGPEPAQRLYDRVTAKLQREAVEDYRVDFEDGFGHRPDAEEDEAAVAVAVQMARGMKAGMLPPFIGIRIKAFSEELKSRSVRTLDLFLARLLAETGGVLPNGFVVTLPKITHPAQIGTLAQILTLIEEQAGLPHGAVKLEFMVETPESILDADGDCALPELVYQAEGRCRGAHFGTYDFTAALDIPATHQTMDHPACDFARYFMKVALAGTGVWISDGATTIMPVGPHRRSAEGELTPEQLEANRTAVHRGWRLSFEDTRNALYNGIYQGWDLHPAQLPARYAAVYSFFSEGLEQVSLRLKNFIESAAKATLLSGVFDDAATGQGLLNYFLRGLNCGAVTLEDVKAGGLTEAEIRTRSFLKILAMRRGN